MSLRVCPRCRTEYDPPRERCEFDGADLLLVADEEKGPRLVATIAKGEIAWLTPWELCNPPSVEGGKGAFPNYNSDSLNALLNPKLIKG
jgi:hypothetical protein